MENTVKTTLSLVHASCCICDSTDAEQIGVGEDFEYRTSSDTFVAMRCNLCGLIYLDPRPALSEFEIIYPASYHAFDFSKSKFGLVYRIRSRLEARRVLSWCKELLPRDRILDVGCGDGFHLGLLKKFGNPGWTLEGVDVDARAIAAAKKSGLTVHLGNVESIDLPEASYDLAMMIQTIEHVASPAEILSAVRKLLKPGGKLIIVTDNTGSPDFHIFKGGYWGGYHFPRHWNLFNKNSVAKLAARTGFEIADVTTQISPVNWVYSIRNALVDWKAPAWLTEQFSLRSTVSLSAFTLADFFLQKLGRGALLRATLRKV